MDTKKNSRKEILHEMSKVYNEFGIDIHSIPIYLNQQINNLVKEIIKLRVKRKQKETSKCSVSSKTVNL